MDPSLLTRVRDEVQESLSFTPKETDIYKIHQSGDLANLDGLEDSALARLPSLLKLRDALYSAPFRTYLARVTDAGPLSGVKTDMAINVYTPGCHLLCHDDVIGSRRLSYILYLTDPKNPWREEWGGALRLYAPVKSLPGSRYEGSVMGSAFVTSIPPAFNQLSFFTVQPGESFHDVEEVYTKKSRDEPDRIRMAISGWYHIPQKGEEGYVPGVEEQEAEKSSLAQLQSKQGLQDLPRPLLGTYDDPADTEEELSEQDLDFLLRYMAPTYLTPDTLEELSEMFAEESVLRLGTFLCDKFCARLRPFIEEKDGVRASDREPHWSEAGPPFKYRYMYQHRRSDGNVLTHNALEEVYEDFLSSGSFRKWLSLATGLKIAGNKIVARRFRRGSDYTLATGIEEGEPSRVELTLNMTPTLGWSDEGDESADEGDEAKETNGAKGRGDASKDEESGRVGGYEVYMAGEDDDDDDDDDDDGSSAVAKDGRMKNKADPAVYSSKPEEDDGVLFSMPASWNQVSIVLRDQGTLKFVKYVSQAAKGDRWDCSCEFNYDHEDNEDEEEEGKEKEPTED